MPEYVTEFGSIDRFEKGRLEIINDDPRNYAFSNIFEVASTSKPYKKVAVGQNFEYVLEAVRAEGDSEWRIASHDEFALVMDGEVEIRLRKPSDTSIVPTGRDGSVALEGEPEGQPMGRLVCRRGHMALLPAGAAYQFRADRPSVMLMQTIAGEGTEFKWAEICQTTA